MTDAPEFRPRASRGADVPSGFGASIGRAVLAFALTGFMTAALAQGTPSRDMSGIWLVENPPQTLRPANGAAVPFTPAGRSEYDSYMSGLKSGKIEDTTRKYCLPDGIPRLLTAPFPFEVVHTPAQVTFLHEARHVYRAVPIDGMHINPDLLIESYMGDAVGRWEGDTLVIDSVGFNTETRLDPSGLPHSGKLRVTERWRRIDGGKRLQADITIEDPDMYTAPWTTRMTFASRNDLKIEEYVCGTKHRDLTQSGVAK